MDYMININSPVGSGQGTLTKGKCYAAIFSRVIRLPNLNLFRSGNLRSKSLMQAGCDLQILDSGRCNNRCCTSVAR